MPEAHPLIEQYLALLDVSEAIARHSDLPALLKDLARRLPRIIPVNFVGLSLYDPERQVMRLHSLEANVPADIVGGHEDALDATPAGLVWETQQPLLIRNLPDERRWSEVIARMQEDGVQSCCLLPLTSSARKLGVLEFASLQTDAYGKTDLDFLQQVGRQVAVAVDNVLNREAASASRLAVERQRDRFGLLLRMTNAMVSKLELRELFSAVSLSLREVVRQEYASLLLYDGEQNRFRLHALDFPDNEGLLAEGLTTDAADSPAAVALRTKRPVVAGETDLATFRHEVIRLLVQKGFKSLCSLPLLSKDRVLGCLSLGSRHAKAFSPSDVEFLSQVAGQIALAVGNALAYQEITQLKDRLAKEKLYLEEEIQTSYNFDEIVGESKPLKRLLTQVQTVAPTDSTVLILGETGSGKELIARALHNLSERKGRTFVKLNCAAIPTGLLESELFGHEKGAFTGAISTKIGRFELADRGTIFLDEVGEIPLELQVKLLRVLQEQEFERLGSTRTVRVDVRVVAATNRDLSQMIEEQKFRSDLYYRLNVFPLTVPPLRDRVEDIPVLVRHFVQKFGMRMKKRIETIPADAMKALQRYSWPGNVRELENFIERSVILTAGPDLFVPLSELKPHQPVSGNGAPTTMEEAEREHILKTLRETNWTIGGASGAAARLGLKRTTLQSRMQKLGISRPR
ncbi:MAG TPA: sigma 54-interacting transcriptional regulator [Nitrospiraceae bacterium]|nr:sigma 54-interacting transcriptional regulator [Nitrospiraceae bacterium]